MAKVDFKNYPKNSKNYQKPRPETREEESLRLALALSASAKEKRDRIDDIREEMCADKSVSSFEETVYDTSLSHPALKVNNAIFELGCPRGRIRKISATALWYFRLTRVFLRFNLIYLNSFRP